MMRITYSKNAQQAKSYHQKSDYYTKGKEDSDQWGGKAAAMLRLSGQVQTEDFESLVDNLHPISGRRLTARNVPNRRPCYDFTFDVPKSCSLLHSIGKDERIGQAIREAVEETMAQMEAYVAVQARNENGGKTKLVTGNWVWAAFEHDTARPVNGIPDPNTHIHAVIINATWDSRSESWKALELRPIKDRAPFFQAAYHARLASKLRALGYDLEKRNKLFEVRGISADLTAKFSNRDKLIRKIARERGITDADEIAGLAALTRESKKTFQLSQDELEARWIARTTLAEQSAILEAIERARTRSMERVPSSPCSPAVERHAIELALQHCLERKSTVTEHEVLAFALNHAVVEDVDPERMYRLLKADPHLIRSEVNGRWLLTTPEVVAEERDMLQFVQDGRGTVRPLVSGHQIADDRLSAEQRVAVLHVLESRDRVTGIAGRAGVGKTTLLREAVAAMEAAGHRVVTVAPTAEAARDVLRKEGFKNADTVAALLANPQLQEQARHGVLLVDEAGLLSTRQIGRLFDLAEKLDARVVLVGDTGQHHAVERGDALRLLTERAGLELADVSMIRRQDGLYREAVECLADGDVTGAFKRFDRMGAIFEIDDDARHMALAGRYVDSVSKGKSVLIVSPTHAEIREVTNAVREKLQSEGRLKNQRSIDVLRGVDLTEAQREDLANYHDGQIVQFTKSAKGVKAGQRLEVVEVLSGGVVARDLNTGREVLLDVERLAERFNVYERDTLPVGIGERLRITQNGKTNGHRISNGNLYTVIGFDRKGIKLEGGVTLAADWCHVTHGYAVSSHASQGKSVDEILLAISEDSLAATNLEQIYVSASRGRQSMRMYTHSRDAVLDAAQVSDRRLSAMELLDHKSLEQNEIEPTPRSAKSGLGQDPLPRRKVVEPLRDRAKEREREIEMAY